jgi:LPS-assembly protein
MYKKLILVILAYAHYLHAADFDDWHDLPADQSFCRGEYVIPQLENLEKSEINADAIEYSQKAMSVLTGNVIYKDHERKVGSQQVKIYRDPDTKEFKVIVFSGDVKLTQKQLSIISDEAQYDLINKDLISKNTQYHIYQQHARGKADQITAHNNEFFKLTNASYTTCGPNNNGWKLKAKELKLDYPNNKGTARSAVLYAKNVPVFYTPYVSFQLEPKRASGFLMPMFHHSNDDGFIIGVPYYFNLAPNYDDTFVPAWFEKRGVQLSNEFRYLTRKSDGFVKFQIMPHDRRFASFREDNLNSPPAGIENNDPRYVDLKDASSTRWSVSAHDFSRLNKNFDLLLDYNRNSDSEYNEDFKENTYKIGNINNLLQQAALNFHSRHWNSQILVKQYQTLHPIDGPVTQEPYKLLPQFYAQGYYPSLLPNLDFNFFGQATLFQKTSQIPDGLAQNSGREVIIPRVAYNISNEAGYITPAFALRQINYQLNNHDPAATFPIVSVDSGLFFERSLNIKHNYYTQTLEPRLFYLYVPYKNQDHLPEFDTAFNTFSYEQLFRTNFFSGYDRQSNMNLLTYALSSRIFNAAGENKLTAQIGQSYYIQKNKVNFSDSNLLQPDQSYAALSNNAFSPIIGNLNVSPIKNFMFSVEELLNTHPWQNYKTSVFFNYYQMKYKKQRLIQLGYSFLRNGDIQYNVDGQPLFPINDSHNNLHMLKMAIQYPINMNWNFLGFLLYDLKDPHIIDSLAGLEYESCCFAIRGGVRKYMLIRANVDASREYNYSIFLEFALKGLAGYSVGNSMVDFLASKGVQNYIDNFGKHY